MAVLTNQEKVFVGGLKEKHVLRLFTPSDTKQISNNGAIFITCGDGDLDYSKHYNFAVSDRPHEFKLFGGTMNVCPTYRGYRSENDDLFLSQVYYGFRAKTTTTLNLGHHYPCAMATDFNHSIEDVFYFSYIASRRWRTDLMAKLNEILPPELRLRDERVFDYFHLKKINSQGVLEQNTYIFDPDMYADCFLHKKAA